MERGKMEMQYVVSWATTMLQLQMQNKQYDNPGSVEVASQRERLFMRGKYSVRGE